MKAPARALELVAIGLLAVHAIRYKCVEQLAALLGFSVYAMNYMLDGAMDVAMWGVIAFLIWGYRGKWRTLGLAVCATGMVEGAQIAGCRFLISDISKVPEGKQLCDYVTGLPIGSVIVGLELLILIWVLSRNEPE